jgi:phage terminase large subunit-like protein
MTKGFENNVEAFGSYFFPNHFKLETPKFHKDIYNIYESSANLIALGAPRGHGKSTITDLVFLSHQIVYKKVKFVLLISDTYSQATLFLGTLKAEFEENEKLKLFYGKLSSNNWSENEIVVGDTMIKALGAGMKVRGLKYRETRPDLIIIDDLENDDLVSSIDRREKLKRWFNGALIPCMEKTGKLIMIGTILHYDSLMANILDEKQYSNFFKKTYKAITDGKALWPEHLNLQELEKIKREYVEKGYGYLFYQEYQNDPISDENRKFKIEKLKFYEEKDLENKSLKCFISIDRAYSKEVTADYTGIIINRVDNENNWYIKSERFKGTESELIEKIFDLKEYFKPLKIGVEQKAFEYTIKPAFKEAMQKRNKFFTIEELKDAGNSKTRRIEGLLPRYEMGTIHFLRSEVDIIDELTRFPKGANDDLIDALAYQLELAVNVMIRKQEKENVLKDFDFYKKDKYLTGSVYLR